VKGLVLSGRNEDDLTSSANEAKARATNPDFKFLIVVGDVGEESDIIRLIDESVAFFGRIDYAVNNAGVGLPSLQLRLILS
jgi:NAD(P)-dependent dehydrogenase (short-subunit alcohol dehydrogenase family)